jgi:anti-sigma regulatory factor (Ser/Thr protein kinase)
VALFENIQKKIPAVPFSSSSSPKKDGFIEFPINDEYSIYPLLRFADELGKTIGLNKVQKGETEIALKELISNVLKHGGGKGIARLRIDKSQIPQLEIEVEDWGKGILDVYKVLDDGYSTGGGGIGGGLPAVNRLMDSFKLISRPNGGAYFRAVKMASPENLASDSIWRFSVYSQPRVSEEENGDGYFLRRGGKNTVVALIDGLGHGIEAHYATQLALSNIEKFHHWNEEDLIQLLHEKLHNTRGVVIGILKTYDALGYVRYTGIGNIFGVIVGKKNVSFLNYNGTVGSRLRKLKSIEYPMENDAIVALHSDGISMSWLERFYEVWKGNLQSFTRDIIQKFGRKNDDATIIAGWKK